MLEEHSILSKFRTDVNEHIEIIEGEIKKGNLEEAALWINELFAMRRVWQEEFDKPGMSITPHPWVNPKTLNTNSTKRLAKERIQILDEAIYYVQNIMQSRKAA